MSPAFAQFMPRPPAENFTQAFQQGQSNAARNQLVGLQTASAQQEIQQAAQLFPSKLQQQQAAAQEQQMRLQQAQQAQKDANIFATAYADAAKTAAPPAAQGSSPAVPKLAAGNPETDQEPVETDGTKGVQSDDEDDAALHSRAQAQPATASVPPTSGGPAGTVVLPKPATDSSTGDSAPISMPSGAPGNGDIIEKTLALAESRGMSPMAILNTRQQLAQVQEQLAKTYGEKQKVAATNWNAAADRFDAYAGNDDSQAKETDYTPFVSGLVRDGIWSRDEAMNFLTQHGQYPGDAAFKAYAAQHRTGAELMARNLKQAQIDKADLENQGTRAAGWSGQMTDYLGLDEDTKAKTWKYNVMAGVKLGRLTQKQGDDIVNRYPLYPGDKIATTIGNQFLSAPQLQQLQKGQLDTQKAQEEIDDKRRLQQVSLLGSANSQQDYAKRLSGISKSDVVKFGYPDPSEWNAASTPQAIRQLGMTPEQQSQAVANAQPKTEAELARDAADPTKPASVRAAASEALRRLDQSKLAARPVTNITTVPGLGGAGASKLTGEDYLSTLPSSAAAQVRAVAEGRAVMPSATSRAQAAQDLRSAVFAFDPSYSDQRAQVRKAFTTGPDGKNIGSLNTATVHLDQLDEAAKAMQNGNFTPGNQIYNDIRSMFGSTAPTNFATVKSAVAGEMANALKGNATDPEIAEMKKNLNSANSFGQLHEAIQTNLHVLGAKLNTYHERYQQQIPGDTTWSPVMASARAVYDKHGIDPTAPASVSVGYTHTATGPGGHKIGTNDGKTWFDLTTGKPIQ